ncbi:uncharacterized protein LOC134798051 [Cydia splendana]|uniref:uncharacterized protein LOC134798051 n=1 Tax=Cydia splendana TaxID=1100963 RepID=UPI00300D93B9
MYINSLIEELSSADVGCSVDGCFVNNISYADYMVLLSPSVNGLRILLDICERYAVAHGLKYNVKKKVKITLFKTYCQTLYTCNLWSHYSKKAYSALRVQYNNAFRASGMFAAWRTDSFQAVMRKRVASLGERVRGSANTLLKVIAERMDSPIFAHWMSLHVNCNYNYTFY